MSQLLDFDFYCKNVLKIKTKVDGLKPLSLRHYQRKYIEWKIRTFSDGIVRIIVLKPRQAGFSTLEAAHNVHCAATKFNERCLVMADKLGRTMELHNIYSTYVENMPTKLRPMIYKNNSDEIIFDNPLK